MSDIAPAERRTVVISQNGRQESQALSRNAAMVADRIEGLEKAHDQLKAALDTANARIEQFQKNETRILEQWEGDKTRLLSELEGERARTAEANEEAESARTRQAQLETVLAGIRNTASDALPA